MNFPCDSIHNYTPLLQVLSLPSGDLTPCILIIPCIPGSPVTVPHNKYQIQDPQIFLLSSKMQVHEMLVSKAISVYLCVRPFRGTHWTLQNFHLRPYWDLEKICLSTNPISKSAERSKIPALKYV